MYIHITHTCIYIHTYIQISTYIQIVCCMADVKVEISHNDPLVPLEDELV